MAPVELLLGTCIVEDSHLPLDFSYRRRWYFLFEDLVVKWLAQDSPPSDFRTRIFFFLFVFGARGWTQGLSQDKRVPSFLAQTEAEPVFCSVFIVASIKFEILPTWSKH